MESSDKDSAVWKIFAKKFSKLMNSKMVWKLSNRQFTLTVETDLFYKTEIWMVSHSFLQPSSRPKQVILPKQIKFQSLFPSRDINNWLSVYLFLDSEQ